MCLWACAQKEEEFFACKWSVEERTGAPLLLIAGKKGLLKVLNCVTETLEWVRPCIPHQSSRAHCAAWQGQGTACGRLHGSACQTDGWL